MENDYAVLEASTQTPSETIASFGENLLLSIDAETECARGCLTSCKHALYPHTARITIIGAYYEDNFGVPCRTTFRSIHDLRSFLLRCPGYRLVGHNLKFDLRLFAHHGLTIPTEHWVDDTQLLAATTLSKIPDAWLEKYADRRDKLNESLPKGKQHRAPKKHSLKTLAPYFLGVEAFWENPLDHNNEEYVLLDCEYTYRLRLCLQDLVERDNLGKFYARLLRWNKMLLDAECRGIQLDMGLVDTEYARASDDAARFKRDLDSTWADAYGAYFAIQSGSEFTRARERADRAFGKLKKQTPEKYEQVQAREMLKATEKVKKLPRDINLNSPTQLTWLLRDHFGFNIQKFDEDESTGKEVLQRLSATGRGDIDILLKYRQASKLSTAFFPTYKDLADANGVLHTFFNPTGTRTGRLSSSGPNLQQVPSELHRLFLARLGYYLITRDLAAIEPAIIGYYTDCPVLCELLMRSGDFHSQNAIIMFGLDCAEHEVKEKYPLERKLAKTVGLMLLYGAGPTRIQATAQLMGWVWSEEKCQDIYENFKHAYIEVFNFKFAMDQELRNGGCTTNLFGRKHSYPNRRDIHMKGFNSLIQSSASDLLLESSYAAREAMLAEGIEAHPLLWVHDEIVFEVKQEHCLSAEKILEHHLTKHKLTTRFGNIPLRCEGNTASYWSK